jgi:molybdenum cofactor cytidylyltransferase
MFKQVVIFSSCDRRLTVIPDGNRWRWWVRARRTAGGRTAATSVAAVLIVAVVLAAGAGSRFRGGGHKLDAEVTTELGTRPLVEHAIEHALDGRVGPVVVVTGAASLSLPEALAQRVTIVVNDEWADGQSSSIAAGIACAADLGADHVVIGLGDQPGVTSSAWHTVADAPAEWPIVVATYDGRRGPHPVRLHRSIWPLLPSTGEDGARNVMREHPALVHEVPCSGTAADIDTLEDVQRWKSS